MYDDYFLMQQMMNKQMMAQQAQMQQEQMMMQAAMQNSQAIQNEAMMRKQFMPKQHTPSKREILDYLKQYTGAVDVVACDDFETLRARHICEGTKEIKLLEMCSMPVNMGYTMINVEYFICPNCRKLIYNRSSITV